MELQHIPLSNLKVAAVNVRHGRKSPDISDILPSIRARGVLQPLLVRPNEEGFEIIAGRRRYFAASKVAEERGVAPDEVLLPCAVTATGDDTGAMEASLIENVARQPMDELQEYEAFAKPLKQGHKVEEIASMFGVTELRVRWKEDRDATAKSSKDRLQARSIIEAMIANRQHADLASAFTEAWDRGDHWKAAIRTSIATYDDDFQSSFRTELTKGVTELGSNPTDYDLADKSIDEETSTPHPK
jgi:ParB/RepB/Spo0J family partition protein